MGHFVGVYTAELSKLESVIGSRSVEHVSSILEAWGGRFNHHPLAHQRILAALENILAGSYPSGEVEGGHDYVYAFQTLCRTFARKWTVQEIYVAEDSFPDIFAFVWGAVENEDDFPLLLEDNPFELPRGEFGPVCFYRGLQLVKQEIQRLSSLDYDNIAALNDTDYREEIAAILEVLRAAEQTGQGVFVFWFE
jgi:hypothetical protein